MLVLSTLILCIIVSATGALVEETTTLPEVVTENEVPPVPVISKPETAKLLLPDAYYKKAYSYVKNTPMFKNASKEGLVNFMIELETWKPPEDFVKDFPYYLAGYDLEDQPVWVIESGKFDIRSVVERGPESVKMFIKYSSAAIHHMIKSVYDKDTPDREVRNVIFLVDMDSFDLRQITHTETVRISLNIMRDNKEIMNELIGKSIIINANHFAHLAMNIARPILGHLMERIEIYGTNKAKWLPLVRRSIPDNVIPTWYGGTPGFKPIQVYG